MPEHPLIISARTLSVARGTDHALDILDQRAGTLLRIMPPSAATPEWLAELHSITQRAAEIIAQRAAERRAEAAASSSSSSRPWEETAGSRFD